MKIEDFGINERYVSQIFGVVYDVVDLTQKRPKRLWVALTQREAEAYVIGRTFPSGRLSAGS